MYLEHHGILGMHWGIRRYQNKDGSLTAEGEKRYLTNKGFRRKIDKANEEIRWKNDESLYNEDGSLNQKGAKKYLKNKKFRRMIDKDRQQAEKERRIITNDYLKNLDNQQIRELASRVENEVKIQTNLSKLIRTIPKTPSEQAKEFVKNLALNTGKSIASSVANRIGAEINKNLQEAIFGKESTNQNNQQKHDKNLSKEQAKTEKERRKNEKKLAKAQEKAMHEEELRRRMNDAEMSEHMAFQQRYRESIENPRGAYQYRQSNRNMSSINDSDTDYGRSRISGLLTTSGDQRASETSTPLLSPPKSSIPHVDVNSFKQQSSPNFESYNSGKNYVAGLLGTSQPVKKTYDAEVIGEGSSSRRSSEMSYNIIDVDYKEVKSSPTTSIGSRYVEWLLGTSQPIKRNN